MEHDLAAPRWVSAEEAPSWEADEILHGLFMGGTDDDDVVHVPVWPSYDLGGPRAFDAVVTLFAWAQPVSWEVEELRYGFGDGTLDEVHVGRLLRAAHWAWTRWTSGDRVLIRCQAGLNRSGLVAALVLMLEGYDAADAIRHLRGARSPWVLCNNDFVRWLVTEAESQVAPLRHRGDPAVAPEVGAR